ncbi:MAG: dihydroorotase [Defluviitaleaceae bacterium]|nr:dihydroorotase [Defluviitaleaceae bacterium]
MKILIKNGRVIDPANNIDEICDIFVEDGKIKEIDKNITKENEKTINADKMWVTPGLIDMHVHLREPGFKYKETISTGTKSAAMGGFTTICAMANTKPTVDNEIIVEYINSKIQKEAIINVFQVGAITKDLAGEELSQIGEMKKVGICAISDDGLSVKNANLLKQAMKYANMFDLPILSHCEDTDLTAKGQINSGKHSDFMGFRGISNDSEELIVSRDIILANSVDARLHIMHVSARESLEHIRFAKSKGQKVTAEVCPHHFTLCDEDIKEYDANFKMSPPLRAKEDVEALIKALQDGTIDVIATDHAPHHKDEKNCEFELAANGIVGLETAVPLCITELVNKNILSPKELIEKLTINPARILNLNKGTLSVGADADITIIDPNLKYKIDKNKFESLSKNTPFHGREVQGKAAFVIVNGKIVLDNGELCKTI